MSNEPSMLRDSVGLMLLRDLRATEQQIAAYPDDESLWLVKPGISNSAGTLALHIAGNLRHFIGAALGKSDYVRDRDAEFANHQMSRADLRAVIESTITEVQSALEALNSTQIGAEYPIPIGPEKITAQTSDMLLHLAVHLTYHLGQIDYHRRLLTADPQKLDTLSLRSLAR